jgi:AcrR family transcriptional regulator
VTGTTKKPVADAPRRTVQSYDGALRQERAEETRERIITAGTELVHRESVRDWKTVTIRAVAVRAGVNERTVYRYFGNERGLRDALLQRIEQDSGIDVNGMQLGQIGQMAAKILGQVSQYPRDPRPQLVPTLEVAKERQQAALLEAVSASAEELPDELKRVVAAMLDVQWSVATYERLIENWQIDHDLAVRGVQWVLELIGDAIERSTSLP